MDGGTRVSLIPKYCPTYHIAEEDMIRLLLVVEDERQLKQCCGLIMEGYTVKEVVDVVVLNLI